MALVDAYECSDCPPSSHTFYANAEDVNSGIPVGNIALRELPAGGFRCVTIARGETVQVDESVCVDLVDSEAETCAKCKERWED